MAVFVLLSVCALIPSPNCGNAGRPPFRHAFIIPNPVQTGVQTVDLFWLILGISVTLTSPRDALDDSRVWVNMPA